MYKCISIILQKSLSVDLWRFISQYRQISNHYVVHMKLTECMSVIPQFFKKGNYPGYRIDGNCFQELSIPIFNLRGNQTSETLSDTPTANKYRVSGLSAPPLVFSPSSRVEPPEEPLKTMASKSHPQRVWQNWSRAGPRWFWWEAQWATPTLQGRPCGSWKKYLIVFDSSLPQG